MEWQLMQEFLSHTCLPRATEDESVETSVDVVFM